MSLRKMLNLSNISIAKNLTSEGNLKMEQMPKKTSTTGVAKVRNGRVLGTFRSSILMILQCLKYAMKSKRSSPVNSRWVENIGTAGFTHVRLLSIP